MTEKPKIHCLHICGHLDAMMEEAANKKFEERQQAIKPPVQCSTAEDSGKLHEIYKDRVRGTEPSVQKQKLMKELMLSIEHAQLAHSMMLLQAKQEESGVKRRPSTLGHMHHDDSDGESEVGDDSTDLSDQEDRASEGEIDVFLNERAHTPAFVVTTASSTEEEPASSTQQEEPASSTEQDEPVSSAQQGEPATATEHEGSEE